jgi:hypothetical protein
MTQPEVDEGVERPTGYTYTLRGIEPPLWAQIRSLAQTQRRTIRQVMLMALVAYVNRGDEETGRQGRRQP